MDLDIVQEISSDQTIVEQKIDIEVLMSPSTAQSEQVAKDAKDQSKRILDKVKKMSVAPGEHGSFSNWGSDVFLEEKAFPEKFPYGTGGYLSSCIDNEENNMGFANYCINQIMSADPKFRRDSTYIFFLLLVKELIQLKRCKATYFRQATRLPNLTREDVCSKDLAGSTAVCSAKKHNLTHLTCS